MPQSIDTCERCGEKSKHKYGLLDYCTVCGTDLCPTCMAKGCCGSTPALSGMAEDHPEPAIEEDDSE